MRRSLVTLAVLLAPVPLAAQFGRQGAGGEYVWKSLSAKYDANGDGRIEAAEYARGEEKFRRLDRDGDGWLTEEDFAGRGERRGRGRGGGDFRARAGRMISDRLVRAADADESGEVTRQEWTAFLVSLAADEDGVIRAERLQAVLRERGGGDRRGRGFGERGDRGDRGELRARMVQMLDRDDDGRVEIEDLEAIFSAVDRDGNGSVDAAEMSRRGGASGARRDATVPQVGESAPDFELPYAKDEKRTAHLASFAGRRPVALVFGSYT